MLPSTGTSEVLVLAPHGRDAVVAAALLKETGPLSPTICPDVAAFQAALNDEICFGVITEDSLRQGDLRGIVAWVDAQPSWSDLPFIILTHRGGGPERNPRAAMLSEVLSNVIFLERPFHPTTFVSVARTALKGRHRQYEARHRIEDLRDSEERLRAALQELRRLNETLEERVAQRAADLERAHQLVLEEIEQRRHAEEQLRQAQKMEMLGELTGGVAHDFNNLLMAVLSNLDLLRKQTPAESRAARLIDAATQGARRGAVLTQRLLAFGRRQDLKVEPTDLTELVSGMVDLLRRSIGTQLELEIDLPARLPAALVDANQLELALLNLVVNARDAMPEGGTLGIALEVTEEPAGGGLAGGSYLRLTITDTGHGMDAETLARATEPFFSTKERGKGTGLGLSMVHGLAVQLNGTLRLSSTPGLGTRAELLLPVTERAAKAEAPPAAEQTDEVSGRMTILLVDDDALIALTTADMLEDLGHEVIEADCGAAALEVLRSGRAVDLVITDYAMPNMTGAQLAAAVRELRPGLPVLLATGYAELPSDSGCDLPRLGKPYAQFDLKSAIAKTLKQKAG